MNPLIVFFGVWAVFLIGAQFMKWKHSDVIGLGGGFFIAIFAVFAMNKLTPEEIPNTFEQAGISNKQWNSNNAQMAAKITVNVLQRIDRLVVDADKRGDSAAAIPMLDELLPIIQDWNDQQDNFIVGKYHNCVLATVHVMDGVTSVMNGRRYSTRDRFESALEVCKSAI